MCDLHRFLLGVMYVRDAQCNYLQEVWWRRLAPPLVRRVFNLTLLIQTLGLVIAGDGKLRQVISGVAYPSLLLEEPRVPSDQVL